MPKKSQDDVTAFKNWINADVVQRLALHIQNHHSSFDSKKFQEVSKKLAPLELKARVQSIRQSLYEHLPSDFPTALKILLKAVHKPAAKVTPLHGFTLWPVTDYIQTYGVHHISLSLNALKELTEIFTAEFAVRPFLNQHPKQTYQFLMEAAKSKNEHHRRWASEGSRPRLPWGEQLKEAIKDPSFGIKILEQLKTDDAEYVRKSVANHLNDISKDHPTLAIKISKKWLKESSKEDKPKVQWIVRHGLRTLLKQGNLEALKLLGFSGQVQIQNFKISSKKVKRGESFEFDFTLIAKEKTQVMVDYILHHQKANGKTSPKVFKLATKLLLPGTPLFIQKRHSFKPITTRVYHPGLHKVEIMVNGHRLTEIAFQLI